jgi:endonuclease YncB( thermonuclease family)
MALILTALMGAVQTTDAQASPEVLAGPVPARILRVIDGDTLRVRTRIWLGMDMEIDVRINGIDAPELRGRCNAERRLAKNARKALIDLVEGGTVRLHDIRNGKYAGRVVARVTASNGADIGVALIAQGVARRYDGRRRAGWCGA